MDGNRAMGLAVGALLALRLCGGAQASPPFPASAATPAPVALSAAAGAALHCAGAMAAPSSLSLSLGKSTLLNLPDAEWRTIGNSGVVEAVLVAPDTLYLLGADIGSTNMIIRSKGGACRVIDVTVGIDPAALRAALAALMPDETHIQVSVAADSLVLSGTVEDVTVIDRVLELAGAFVRRAAPSLAPGGRAAGAPPAPGAGAAAGPAGGSRIVNLLAVSAPQQVMLEVKIAEVSKSLMDQFNVGATLARAAGSWTALLSSNFLTGNVPGTLAWTKPNAQIKLEAQKQDGLVRMLAEPTVMAISGQEGSFLAGGKIFIPVAQGNNQISLEEREFGVGLRFTPTVLAGGRINLRVAPEVSELSAQGAGISAAGIGASAVLPMMTTRRASTTVQLMDGQSFAIGGLIKNNETSNLNGLPLLGEVPVLGALFRSTEFQQDRSELVFVVTAHLVKPLPPQYRLPTDSAPPPSRADLFLLGHLEGQAPAPAPVRAPAPAAVQGFELK